MNKLICGIFLILGNSFAVANTGNITIKLKSAVQVEVSTQLNQIEILQTQNGFVIENEAVSVNALSVKPAAARGNLRSEKFLNAEKYPEINVSKINCVLNLNSTNGICKGLLKIKGITQPIQKAVFKIVNNEVFINFSFFLSQYNIAKKVLLFKIQDEAQAQVRIKL